MDIAEFSCNCPLGGGTVRNLAARNELAMNDCTGGSAQAATLPDGPAGQRLSPGVGHCAEGEDLGRIDEERDSDVLGPVSSGTSVQAASRTSAPASTSAAAQARIAARAAGARVAGLDRVDQRP